MKKILLGLIMLMAMQGLHSQTKDYIVGKWWTDGETFYIPQMHGGKIVVSCHTLVYDCNCDFTLIPQGGNYLLKRNIVLGSLSEICLHGAEGDVMKHKQFAGKDYMIIYSKNGGSKEVLLQVPKDSERKTIEDFYMKYLLAGEYTDRGKHFVFYPDRKEASGLEEDMKEYKFANVESAPVPIIIFNNVHAFWVERTDTGLDLYYAWQDEEKLWTQGKLLYRLQKTKRSDTEEWKGIDGFYPYLSVEPMPSLFLNHFPIEELKVMRNEIFARHGYIFNTKSMRDKFVGQSWYKPTKTDVTGELTEVEKINIAQLKWEEYQNTVE